MENLPKSTGAVVNLSKNTGAITNLTKSPGAIANLSKSTGSVSNVEKTLISYSLLIDAEDFLLIDSTYTLYLQAPRDPAVTNMSKS